MQTGDVGARLLELARQALADGRRTNELLPFAMEPTYALLRTLLPLIAEERADLRSQVENLLQYVPPADPELSEEEPADILSWTFAAGPVQHNKTHNQ